MKNKSKFPGPAEFLNFIIFDYLSNNAQFRCAQVKKVVAILHPTKHNFIRIFVDVLLILLRNL